MPHMKAEESGADPMPNCPHPAMLGGLATRPEGPGPLPEPAREGIQSRRSTPQSRETVILTHAEVSQDVEAGPRQSKFLCRVRRRLKALMTV